MLRISNCFKNKINKVMLKQVEFSLEEKPRGFHLITDEVMRKILDAGLELPDTGILNLFIKHCSCSLSINENYDPSVRTDLENIFNQVVPENQSYFTHTLEGPDDMPSHAKSIMAGSSIQIPITNGRLNLGTWQGIYLCEFRNHGGPRQIVATLS